MFWPVAILGLLTVVGGLIGIPGVTNIPGDFLHQAQAAPTREALEAVEFSTAKSWLLALTVGLGAAFLGILGAWLIWGRTATSPLRTKFPRLGRVFQRAFGWDALYDSAITRPVQGIASSTARLDTAATAATFDEVEVAFREGSRIVRAAQSGLLRVYAFGTGVAFVIVVVAFLWVKGS
ncbi:MAG: hypothetical protein H7287_09380 [Thermoleophilia bacterium]|nr:hypothetical protein [Thermoleophilia bacterium]